MKAQGESLRQWAARFPDTLKAAGLADARQILERFPLATIDEIAKELDVIPIVLYHFLGSDALAQGWLDEYAREILYRLIVHYQRDGWEDLPPRASVRKPRLSIAGDFVLALPHEGRGPDRGAMKYLFKHAPLGWIPENKDDPWIVRAWAHGLAESDGKPSRKSGQRR